MTLDQLFSLSSHLCFQNAPFILTLSGHHDSAKNSENSGRRQLAINTWRHKASAAGAQQRELLTLKRRDKPLEQVACELSLAICLFSSATNQCSWLLQIAPSTWPHLGSSNNDRFGFFSFAISLGQQPQEELERKAGEASSPYPSSSDLHFPN